MTYPTHYHQVDIPDHAIPAMTTIKNDIGERIGDCINLTQQLIDCGCLDQLWPDEAQLLHQQLIDYGHELETVAADLGVALGPDATEWRHGT